MIGMKVSNVDPTIIQRILEEYPNTDTRYLSRKYAVNVSNIRALANQYGVFKHYKAKDVSHRELFHLLRDSYLRGYADAGGDITTDTFRDLECKFTAILECM